MDVSRFIASLPHPSQIGEDFSRNGRRYAAAGAALLYHDAHGIGGRFAVQIAHEPGVGHGLTVVGAFGAAGLARNGQPRPPAPLCRCRSSPRPSCSRPASAPFRRTWPAHRPFGNSAAAPRPTDFPPGKGAGAPSLRRRWPRLPRPCTYAAAWPIPDSGRRRSRRFPDRYGFWWDRCCFPPPHPGKGNCH